MYMKIHIVVVGLKKKVIKSINGVTLNVIV